MKELEAKLRKLNRRYKDLGKAHGLLCQRVDLVLRELTYRAALHPDIPPLVDALKVALADAKRSHQPGIPKASDKPEKSC